MSQIVMIQPAEVDQQNSEDAIPTKEERIQTFIKDFNANEEQIEPFKEHRRDLKKSYIENKWLTREEISLTIKAYRMLKRDEDLGEIEHYMKIIEGK
jgi:hypothetical protein